MRRPLLTIKAKTSLLFLGLGSLLALTGVLVFLQLTGIQLDTRRLLEETRESILSSELYSTIHDIEVAVRQNPKGFQKNSKELAQLRTSMGKFRNLLRAIRSGGGSADPSRGEHQRAENMITIRILDDMDALEETLEASGIPEDKALEKLAFAKRYTEVLFKETKEESTKAHSDLNTRADDARWLLGGSFSLVILGFVWLGSYFFRRVASPILSLRDGTDRFGSGDLAFRLPTGRRDEIGQLAVSFNEMAERIHKMHKELEQSLAKRTRDFIRAARFADLGVLAAGLAHEINNPLASIASSAEGLERRIHRGDLDDKGAVEYLRTIAAEAYRAKGITERLLALSRPGDEKQGTVDLKLVLGHLDMMFRHQIEKRGLELRMECDKEIPWVYGNPESFVQVFSNLLRNAEDASPPGGSILIRCVGEGGAFHVEILDEGPGLSPEEQKKIFDPFYTTKDPGKGTGLGLSLVTSLLASMGGRIEVRNREEGGCCFAVYPSLEVGEGSSPSNPQGSEGKKPSPEQLRREPEA